MKIKGRKYLSTEKFAVEEIQKKGDERGKGIFIERFYKGGKITFTYAKQRCARPA